PDARELVSVYRLLAPLLVGAGEGAEAERLAERVVALRQQGTTAQRAQAWIELAAIQRARCRLDAARASLAEARALAAEELEAPWAESLAAGERAVAEAACPPPARAPR